LTPVNSQTWVRGECSAAIIVDGDDTLWKTQELYDRAKTEFARLLKQRHFRTPNPIDILDDIDAQNVALRGFSNERFVESLLETYAHLCKQENRHAEPGIERQIRLIGASTFARPQLYEDTVWAISTLGQHYILALATKGEPSIQNAKVDALGLRRCFHRVYCLQKKTEYEYSQIVSDLGIPKQVIWVIGNSVKSDINPALKLDLRTILIPRGIWRYEQEILDDREVIIVQSLKEATRVILTRDSTQV